MEQDLPTIFKGLGHEFRLQLVKMLMHGQIQSCCAELTQWDRGCCVTDITDRFPLAQSTVSHHLKILQKAGILTQEQKGLWSIYRLNDGVLLALEDFVNEWSQGSRKGGAHAPFVTVKDSPEPTDIPAAE